MAMTRHLLGQSLRSGTITDTFGCKEKTIGFVYMLTYMYQVKLYPSYVLPHVCEGNSNTD